MHLSCLKELAVTVPSTSNDAGRCSCKGHRVSYFIAARYPRNDSFFFFFLRELLSRGFVEISGKVDVDMVVKKIRGRATYESYCPIACARCKLREQGNGIY